MGKTVVLDVTVGNVTLSTYKKSNVRPAIYEISLALASAPYVTHVDFRPRFFHQRRESYYGK